jgi:hypothetical protein
MAPLVQAWMFTLANDPGLLGKARALVQTAAALTMNDRERAHLAALEHATAGARSAAVALLDRHLMHYPFDLVAHQAATLIDGYLGRFRWVRDRSARALPRWSKDMPGYGTMLAFHGFGLEEAGDYARAEDESRAAAELEPHSFWPHHTVSQSLFHIELGQYDAALALYDGPLLESLRPLGLNLCNLSALLWRLDMLRCDVSEQWRDLVTRWEGHADGRCLVFTDVHAAMAELRSGQEALAERRMTAMRETAASSAEAASCYRDVGIPLVEGLMAFHRGTYEQAVAMLQPARFDLWRIGGSNAQRDIIDWTVTEAAIRAGLRDVALALSYERLGTRPRSVVNRDFLRRAEQIAA